MRCWSPGHADGVRPARRAADATGDRQGRGWFTATITTLPRAKRTPHPVIDYQLGSIRDDFNFGSVLLFERTSRETADAEIAGPDYKFAGLYALRLAVSRARAGPANRRIPLQQDRNRHPQDRREAVRLRRSAQPRGADRDGAGRHRAPQNNRRLPQARISSRSISRKGTSKTKPRSSSRCKNREKTDRRRGRLGAEAEGQLPLQRDHRRQPLHRRNDRTSCAITPKKDSGVIHVIPERTDLGIGGCWNEGVAPPAVRPIRGPARQRRHVQGRDDAAAGRRGLPHRKNARWSSARTR